MVEGPINCTLEDLADRAKSFELFRKSYRKNEAMEENRELLKEKYSRGKQLGVSVNNNRQLIKDLTNKIEQIRKQNAMRGLVDESGEIIKTDEEEKIQLEISKLKQTYQTDYNELKDLKTEIERIQNLLERCRVRMQKDFEQWLAVMIKHKQS
jgi:kinesin family protein 6/9